MMLLAAIVLYRSAYYTAVNFAITTDTGELISSRVRWRQLKSAFNTAFPDRTGLTLVVTDAPTPEIADQAADDLTDRIGASTGTIGSIRRPNGGPFYARNGLLFLRKEQVTQIADPLLTAQPFLGALAADPNLQRLMHIFARTATADPYSAILDFCALQPGQASSDAIRAAVRDLNLTSDRGIRVRLTGDVPLADERRRHRSE
jgi:uncharacterized protein